MKQIQKLKEQAEEIAWDLLLEERGFRLGDTIIYKNQMWKIINKPFTDVNGRIISVNLYKDGGRFGVDFQTAVPTEYEFKKITKA